jgi:hypothetical protein
VFTTAFGLLGEQVIPGILFFASILPSFFVYERLVKREYEIARDAWEADNRPPGVFWAPPGTSAMRSLTRGRVMSLWIQSTPQWIRADPTARAANLAPHPVGDCNLRVGVALRHHDCQGGCLIGAAVTTCDTPHNPRLERTGAHSDRHGRAPVGAGRSTAGR